LIGKTVSHYRILSKLGEGGMGVVYKAEDTRLDRHVAIKFLPPSLATQDAAKKRFIHEAKAASSLEHPNICAVYDIGETGDGQMFIAMPHYEGETLQERIARGRLEIGEVLDIVTQLASGLAKAHEQGIIHRDIKPGNIFITRDGHVKILDFGLAKLATETRLTKSGMTLGTIAYMSPEQASGGDVDARSDIFSLGVVFYELLTGSLPFKGDHEAAIIYGILHNVPEPLQTHRGDIPEGVQHVIDAALTKNVDGRYQTAQEFKDAVAELLLHTSSRGTAPTRGASRSPFRRVVPWIVLGGAVLAFGLFVVRNALRSPTSDSSPSVSPTYTQLTFTGDAEDPIISPDGQLVVYLRDTGSQTEVLARDVRGGEPIVLLGDITGVESLRWSPNSGELMLSGVASGDERHLYIVPRLGGPVRLLGDYRFAAWSPDGRRVAATWMSWRKTAFIDVSTGKVEADSLKLEFPFVWLHDLDWSPDGHRLLVHVLSEDGDHEIWTVGVNGDDPIRVVIERELSSPRWSPSGEWIYYLVPTGVIHTLWKARVDPGSGDVTGEPQAVLSGITGLGPLAFTRDGKSVAYARHLLDQDLWLLSTDEEQKEGEPVSKRLTSGTALDDWPWVSPNGRDIAFVRVMGDVSNIFIMPIEGEWQGKSRSWTLSASAQSGRQMAKRSPSSLMTAECIGCGR
jgi:serine/threonine protein kinase